MIYDTPSFVALLGVMAIALPNLRDKTAAPAQLPYLFQALALGVLYYVLYTINIGGDYMAGRFFAMPVFVAIWTIFYALRSDTRLDIIFCIAAIFITANTLKPLINDIREDCGNCMPIEGRIIDSQRIFGGNRLFSSLWPPVIRPEGQYIFARDGWNLANDVMREDQLVKKIYYIGMAGYYAGAGAQLIDELGLADPLIARLPAVKGQHFFSSHYRREVPEGYNDAIRTGSLEKMEPNLAQYYDALRTITSGNILDKERIRTILYFNLGYYDHFREAYVQSQKK
jgi:arabinofuranosyltransferase